MARLYTYFVPGPEKKIDNQTKSGPGVGTTTVQASLFSMCILLFLLLCPCLLMNAEESPSSFTIKIEGIYFQPFFNNDFISSPNPNGSNPFNLNPAGPGRKTKFNYTPGWRLSVGYANPCNYIQNLNFRFTGLSACKTKTFDFASFFSDDGFAAGNINTKHRCNYYASDLSTEFCIFHRDCLHCGIQPGLHYVMMQYQSHVHFSVQGPFLLRSGDLKEKSRNWGAGPQLGLKFDWQMCDSVTLQGRINGGVLLSRACVDVNIESFGKINPKNSWKIFPFWETTLSISSWISLYGHLMELTVGYEYLTYPNFINRTQFPSNGSRQVDNMYCTFDFQGPYISANYHF